jgi:hypothetical protein
MGKTNSILGKAVGNHLGYTVRMMVGTKTDEKTKKTYKVHNGKFGIYAGKNKVEEINKASDAPERVSKIVSQTILDRAKKK